MTKEVVRFAFDPSCPWAWQSSIWIREVERVRDVTVEWRLFSLGSIDLDAELPDPLENPEMRGTAALRTLALVGRELGNEAVGRLYAAIGEHGHERREPFDAALVEASLADAGMDPSLLGRALDDASTAEEVRGQHREAAEGVGAFGVPTLILASGRGMFGPVFAVAPAGEEAGELWDHCRWLIDRGDFFELKRIRHLRPGGAPVGERVRARPS